MVIIGCRVRQLLKLQRNKKSWKKKMLIQECQIKTATKIYHYQVNLNKQKLRKTEQHDIQSIQQSSFIRHLPKSVGAALSGPTTATLSAPLYNNFNVLCSVVFLFSMVSTVVICFLQNFSFNRGSFVFLRFQLWSGLVTNLFFALWTCYFWVVITIHFCTYLPTLVVSNVVRSHRYFVALHA